jgi:hypothetical protein
VGAAAATRIAHILSAVVGPASTALVGLAATGEDEAKVLLTGNGEAVGHGRLSDIRRPRVYPCRRK